MNTGKQINAMVVVLFLTLIALGVYAIWDPFRADTKGNKQDDLTLERAATTFALNCRVCHGDRGQGGADGGRLSAARPLNGPSLQGFDASDTFSQAELTTDFNFVFNTITCGRAGTAMPIWGQSQGGTLSAEQIRQLATLITEGKWSYAQEHANEIDAATLGHITLNMSDGLPANATEVVVSNAAKLTRGQYARIPIDEETEERMRILPDELLVQRAVDGTAIAEHTVGATITVAGAPPLAKGENPIALGETMDNDQTFVAVGDLEKFSVGNTISIDGEAMRVLGTATGIPSTRQLLVKDVGREPHSFLVSGSVAIEVGAQIRMDGELMDVVAIRDDGRPDIELAADLSATGAQVSVSDPAFFAEDYVFRVGDELIEVLEPADTGQLLSLQLGRAETSISVTGTDGISEGMVIRLGHELLRVAAIVQPARATIERGVDSTTAIEHAAGTPVLKQVAETTDGQPTEEPDTGQTLLSDVDADDTTIDVTATTGISVNQVYRLADELVRVDETEPAVLRVERAVEGTEAEEHGRRAPVFNGSLLDVARGVQGTTASAHGAGDELFMTELEVKREVGGSKVEDHSKNAEIFLGSSLIVQRGARNTAAADHPNGAQVLDFPLPPDSPATTGTTCGQPAPEGGTSGPTATPAAGATPVSVTLDEFEIVAGPTSGPAGPFAFGVANEGTGIHNFRVIHTDLAADALPVTNDLVDVDQLDVVAESGARIAAGSSETVQGDLQAGAYVLICNVPTHYEQGMHAAFVVQ